jgi:hypothetical protein
MDDRLDLYTDYLLSSVGRTTATSLSRLLSGNEFTLKDLWHEISSWFGLMKQMRRV